MSAPVIPILLGATATGKTAVAIELAKRLDGEIVNADARAIYRGMDIGTAKPSDDERAAAPHHLIDICDPAERYDVYRFRQDVGSCIAELLDRNKRPIIVGGSTLYLRAITEGVMEGAGADPELRAKLESLSTEDLFRRLQRVDPVCADDVDRHNRVRLIRALEVFEQTGQSIRELHTTAEPLPYPFKKFGLFLDREKLYKRINARVDAMISSGLVDEAKRLFDVLKPDTPAYRTIGYQELFEHFQGKLTLAQTVEKIKQHTRNYAKRQLTWHRRDKLIIWLDVEGQTPATLCDQILNRLSRP